MKKIMLVAILLLAVLYSCNTTKIANAASSENKPVLTENDTIRIANKDADFEIIIFDPRFNSWFNTYAKPRSFYTQSYLEARNRVWVTEWNNRAMQPLRYSNIYDMQINYYPNTDYGLEVNYMLFNYLTFFQITYDQRLGGFVPRI